MIKILMVCHGNICRSPMAEYIMKQQVRMYGLEDRFLISSAATSAEEIGNGVYPPAKRKLAKLGIDCSGHKARRIRYDDYKAFDMLIGMDNENLVCMRRFFKGDPENKCSMLMSYAGIDREVADPWYTGDFDAAMTDITKGCRALLTMLISRMK